MSSLLDRIGAFFLERPDDHDAAAPPRPESGSPTEPAAFAPPVATPPAPAAYAPPLPPARASASAAIVSPDQVASSPEAGEQFAVVLGAPPAAAVPVAASCAGELRAQAGAAAAVLCVWGGGDSPTGATTPAVRRLASRLTSHGLAATASGRLAWVALDGRPGEAAAEVRRVRALADVPVVLAVAGPRPPAFEPLIAEAELALVVLPAEAEEVLRALAVATLPPGTSLAVQPLPPGPPRWAAMAGLARMRSLKTGPG